MGMVMQYTYEVME